MKSVYWVFHSMIMNMDVETIKIIKDGEVLEHCPLRYSYIIDKYGLYRVKSMFYEYTEVTLHIV